MKIKDTVAPIPIDLLKEYFSDDSIVFNIDYSESLLKGDKIITYLSNLDVPCKLTGWDKVSTEDKLSFVKEYMNAKLVIVSPELEVCVLKILYEAAEYSFFISYEEYVENILDKDEIEQFIKENKEMIDKWLIMMASLSLFAVYTIPEFQQMVKDEYEMIDDYDYCGVNFARLLHHEIAQELMTAETDDIYYFEKQFNETMFKGKNLFAYWQNDANTLAIMSWAISSGEATYQKFHSEIEKGYENASAI